MSREINGILIDPDRRTVTEVRVRVVPPEPGTEDWCTNDIVGDEVRALVGSAELGAFPMPNRQDTCFYVDGYLDIDGAQVGFWQLPGWDAVPGRCLIVGFDVDKHEYRDAMTAVSDVAASVRWTTRITRAYGVVETGEGVRIDRVAPIVETD